MAHRGGTKASSGSIKNCCEFARSRKRLLSKQPIGQVQSQGKLDEQLDINEELEEMPRNIHVVIRIRHRRNVPFAVDREIVEGIAWLAEKLWEERDKVNAYDSGD